MITVTITGPSGSGKSVAMSFVHNALEASGLFIVHEVKTEPEVLTATLKVRYQEQN